MNKKITIDKIIAIFYCAICIDYGLAYMTAIIKGKFNALHIVMIIIQLSLLIASGAGLWRDKKWARKVAILTNIIIILPAVMRIITGDLVLSSHTIYKFFVVSSCLIITIYFLIKILKQNTRDQIAELNK